MSARIHTYTHAHTNEHEIPGRCCVTIIINRIWAGFHTEKKKKKAAETRTRSLNKNLFSSIKIK